MFSIEEWRLSGWLLARRDIPESERQGLLDANLADGNVYSQDDPTPEQIPPPPKTVFRFVDAPVIEEPVEIPEPPEVPEEGQ
ncbi:hypothetical protein [Micromonospora inyonensis]|uniref:Uncharacterized protein n=1 Tax=Micromonospora inyonensis TaxID=47866 RepID=A0A1C6RX22_9ACTN|nr:hypothetical protein [Micromonospora inyonensis]SCL21512.1 hypothetical protein GA0074694_3057 [Micromonospora inyonensis]SCL21736.1 hypothetical protein GA0074694_3129 [Micromonospora inyonensis]